MTDKQLRSLSKTQLFDLLHKQEVEIERLNAENVKLSEQALGLEQAGSIAEASLLVSGILEAAQKAGDIYLDSIQKVETDKMELIKKLEEESKIRVQKALELKNAESKARIERLIIEILQFFDNQVSGLAAMKEELTELIKTSELEYLIPGISRAKS